MTPRLIQAALNGDREHPATPRTPSDIALQARAAVLEGARSVHVHAYDDERRQTLAAPACAATLREIRKACPGIPISLSTSAVIEPIPQRRRIQVESWTELPDLVTANQGEAGFVELCDLLIAWGVGIEAGLLSLQDTHRFIASGLAARCQRVLVEPLDAELQVAVEHAEAIEHELSMAGICLEQVHHGDGIASWAVNQRAITRGHGIRTGLEDTPVLPSGRSAKDNGELVAAAVHLDSGNE